MGLFSWITQDTERSIPASGSGREQFKVIMLDNKGNKWVEEEYEGYGKFGGKDFYELLAEMNGLKTRKEGIELAYKDNPSGDNTPGVLYPNLVESNNWTWVNEGPDSCEYQGYFYPEDDWGDEDDDWDDWDDEDDDLDD